MQLHWKVLAWMAAGTVLGTALQWFVPVEVESGLALQDTQGRIVVTAKRGAAEKSQVATGDVLEAVWLHRGSPQQARVELRDAAAFHALERAQESGAVLWVEVSGQAAAKALPLQMVASSPRARAIAPFAFAADLFLALLKMLIVPLVLMSVVHGVSGIGSAGALRRLGGKTFAYYVGSSLLAIVAGQLAVNLVRPGVGASLGLAPVAQSGVAPDVSYIEVLRRMVPTNVFAAFTDNAAMLQTIFFALLLGYFITRTPDPHRERAKSFFETGFHVMMRLAEGVLSLIPYGVFALMVQVVASTGVGVFKPLLGYMATVVLALIAHATLTLPFLVWRLARVSPWRWAKAMSPALLTAFSTSSSGMTLPVTLETLEKRGRVSNSVASFTLPLGATINMDGTALYEAVGVIFLAQYYAGVGGFELTFGHQAFILFLALLASIGTAAVPSAGLVMMLTILSALGLPLEGAALLLAVDRPLDMLRTTVNVWSDACGAVVVAASEGEQDFRQA